MDSNAPWLPTKWWYSHNGNSQFQVSAQRAPVIYDTGFANFISEAEENRRRKQKKSDVEGLIFVLYMLRRTELPLTGLLITCT